MKKLTLQEKQKTADALLRRISELHTPGERVRLMEVCGTHTVSIFREGLRQLLPSGIELVSGPGCPVCVTDQVYMDKALEYAKRDDVIGTVELTGATRDCSLLLVPEAKVGDWLLVHAGFAVQIVDEEEAQKTLEAFKELEELEEAYFAGKAEQC